MNVDFSGDQNVTTHWPTSSTETLDAELEFKRTRNALMRNSTCQCILFFAMSHPPAAHCHTAVAGGRRARSLAINRTVPTQSNRLQHPKISIPILPTLPHWLPNLVLCLVRRLTGIRWVHKAIVDLFDCRYRIEISRSGSNGWNFFFANFTLSSLPFKTFRGLKFVDHGRAPIEHTTLDALKTEI